MGSLPEETVTKNQSKPPGIVFIERTKKSSISFKTYQAIVLIVTFLAYTLYHAARKTTSIIKSALDPSSGVKRSKSVLMLKKGWAPFDGPDGTELLGELDFAFLFVYAIGMYFSGHAGDRMDLRQFLAAGMVGTGLFTALFGCGYWLNIHRFSYYLVVQMMAGLFQSTGWPSVVAVVGNWFGKKKRGLIMGIWNAHTSVGNITGSLVASALLKYGWAWSTTVPGLMIAFIGLMVFLFLPVSPQSVGANDDEDDKVLSPKTEGADVTEPMLSSEKDDDGEEESAVGFLEEVTEPMLSSEKDDDGEEESAVGILEEETEPILLSEKDDDGEEESAVGFLEALKIPGVAPFALCLFFSKLVAYTFLYWLPFYICHIAIGGRYLSNDEAGNLSTLFDVGGVVGGILAGHISDHLNARAITAASFTYCAIPALFLYRIYGNVSLVMNIILMLITGMFVNGPYALITTAVSADLGTHSSLKGNSRALATVTAIIDGTGSIGAAVGPLLTGYISAKSWNGVFMMLMVAALTAGLLLTKLVVAEVAAKIEESRSRRPRPFFV